MKYRTLGASGARVSELCLGAMTFGEADERSMMHKVSTPEAESLALMSRALEAGINFWDTANVYGQDGLSERVIGRWFRDSGRRDQVVLATKCRFGMGNGDYGSVGGGIGLGTVGLDASLTFATFVTGTSNVG